MASINTRSSSSGKSPNWLDLPPEITYAILQKVGAVDILINVQLVCTSWHTICKDPSMWKSIDLLPTPGWQNRIDAEKLAMHAVERSCGQLIDISIAHFPSSDFIQYLAQSSCQLRRLKIAPCPRITEVSLRHGASMSPIYEQLGLESFDSICHSGRVKKKLKLIGFKYIELDGYYKNLNKLIASTMPQLHHLELIRSESHPQMLPVVRL